MSKKSHLFLLISQNLLLSSAFFCLAACSMNPEYAQKIGVARTDCKGDEIVGVWQASEEVEGAAAAGPTAYKKTMLIRPDGTGLYRSLGPMYDEPSKYQVNWSYSGNGIWRAVLKDVGDDMIKSIDQNVTIRYTGNEILWDNSEFGIVSQNVFARSQL